MYSIWYSSQFKKDLKRAVKRGCKPGKVEAVIDMLASGEPLSAQYHDHTLSGNWVGCRECHISPDWLLIYVRDGQKLILTLMRTGTHSDLFD